MDPQSRNELIRLYELAESATVTTNFYDRVYKYIHYINGINFLIDLLEKDNVDWHIYDVERLDTVPKQAKGESYSKHFIKEMRHMNSGDSYFLSHYFLTLTVDVHDFYDFHYREGREYLELDIMMNGRKVQPLKDRILNFFRSKDLFYEDPEEFNRKYIDNLKYWKTFLKSFHELLLQRIDKAEGKRVLAFVLNNNGSYLYKGKAGTFTVSSSEYKLLKLLHDNKSSIVSNKDIIKTLFQKEESKYWRMRVNAVIRNIKKGLGILPKNTSYPNIIINHRKMGYVLDL